jgi:arylsulfatase A-like enzyme
MGPHHPYAPPAPFDRAFSQLGMLPRLSIPPEESAGPNALTPEDREQMVAQYDAEILWHDSQVGALLDGLRQAGRLDDTLVVLTADHGEAFGEHGLWAHGTGLFEEIVHIPLIVWRSGSAAGQPRRVASPVSLQDVAPTLSQLALGKTPASFEGESLLPLLQADAAPDADRTVLIENPLKHESGLRSRAWAYQEVGGSRSQRWLYSAEDSKQERELAGRLPDVADALSELSRRAQHDARRALRAPRIELDEARRERLRALGYLR